MSSIIYLSNDTESIKYLSQKDKRLAKVIEMVGDISYKPYDNDYSFLVNQIIGQMLSAKVSLKISERLVNLCNGEITPEAIISLDNETIKSTGMSSSKVSYIKNLSQMVLNKEIDFDSIRELDDKNIIKELSKIKGIGSWTSKMYLIFALNRQDVLPYEDMAFLQSYSWMYKTDDLSRQSIEKRCKKWKPYTSIGARYLYKALDLGYIKQEFHLYK